MSRTKVPLIPLELIEGAGGCLSDVDIHDCLSKPATDAEVQGIISALNSSVKKFCDADAAFLADPRTNPLRMKAFCEVLHSTTGISPHVSKFSGAALEESCKGLLRRASVLETARQLTRRFI